MSQKVHALRPCFCGRKDPWLLEAALGTAQKAKAAAIIFNAVCFYDLLTDARSPCLAKVFVQTCFVQSTKDGRLVSGLVKGTWSHVLTFKKHLLPPKGNCLLDRLVLKFEYEERVCQSLA